MYKKFINVILLVLAGIIVLGTVFLVIFPAFTGDMVSFYVRLFLMLVLIQTFAILRLYNALVVNTRFSIKLRDVISKLSVTMVTLERPIKSLGSQLGVTKNTMEKLNSTTTKHSEILSDISDSIKNNNLKSTKK